MEDFLVGLAEYMFTLQNKDFLTTVYNAILVDKCLRARLWENSKHVARQLEKIGADSRLLHDSCIILYLHKEFVKDFTVQLYEIT